MKALYDDKIVDNNSFVGFWKRLLAYIIDAVVLLPCALIHQINERTFFNFYIWVFLMLVSFCYKFLMEGYFGYTIGKKLLKIQIVTEYNKKITYTHAFKRSLPLFIMMVMSIYSTYYIYNNDKLKELARSNEVTYKEFVKEKVEVNKENQKNNPVNPLMGLWGLLLIVDYISIGFSKRKLALHDRLAKTYCVRLIQTPRSPPHN